MTLRNHLVSFVHLIILFITHTGKSTLFKMIAAGELKIPPRIDVLYVEQEVLADDTPAVDAVLKADKYATHVFNKFHHRCHLFIQ